MVGVFLRVDIGLWPELPSAGEVIGILEDCCLDAYDIGRIERMGLMQLKYAEDRRLGRDRAVVTFQREPVETI